MITPVTRACAGQAISGMVRTSLLGSPGARTHWGVGRADNRRMVDDIAPERAIYQTLKAADEVAAALQAPDRRAQG
jgi:hypothetical protein